jgi:very-short-patch-repair endonuclease
MHSTDAEMASEARRTAERQRADYRVFRVCKDDVYRNLDTVLDELLAFLEAPR